MKKVVARNKLWRSSCKFRNIMEAVRFNTYCHICKHKLKGVNDQPCYDCISKSTAYKPIKFEPDICEGR